MKRSCIKSRVGIGVVLSLLTGVAALAQALEPRPEETRAKELLGIAAEHALAGRGNEALVAAEEAEAISRELGDLLGRAAGRMLAGLAYMARDDTEQAVEALEASAAIFRGEDDLLSAWLVLWMLGEVERNQGHTAISISHLEQALLILAEIGAEPGSLQLDGFLLIGGACGAPVEMFRSLGPMAKLAAPILIQFAEGVTRGSYGAALTKLGRLAEAEAELDKALAASQLFGGIFDASLHAHFGDLRRRQWRLAEAREHYIRALAGLDVLDTLPFVQDARLEVTALGQLAEIDALAGHFEEALGWNNRALARVRKDDDRRREARVLTDRADLLKRASRLGEAEEVLQAAHSLAVALQDDYRQAVVLLNLGTVALFRSNYGRAARQLEQAAGRFRELGLPLLELAAQNQLAEVYFLLESPEQARIAIERAALLAEESQFDLAQKMTTALDAWRKFQSGEGDLAAFRESWSNLWESGEMRALGAPAKFEELGDQILAFAGELAGASPRTPEPPHDFQGTVFPFVLPLSYFLQGKMALDRGDFVEARRVWEEALAEFERMGNRDLAASMAAGIGATYWKEGKAEEAIRWLRKAVEGFEEIAFRVRAEELLSSYLGSERRWFFDLLIEFLTSEGRFAEAFEVSERARARAFLRLLGNQRISAVEGEPSLVREEQGLRAAMLDWELALSNPGGDRDEIRADLKRARGDYEHLLVRLKVTNPEYASLVAVEPPDLAEVQAGLASGEALISYFFTATAAHAWIVGADSLHHITLPGRSADLAAQVRTAAAALGRRGETAKGREVARGVEIPAGFETKGPSAEDLYHQLVAPLRPYLQGAKKLIVVPHGALHYLPFAALRDPDTGRYLVEDYTLTYAPSAGVRRFLRAKESPVEGRALVLGRPEELDPRLPELPATETEAEFVAQLLGTRAFVGAGATESRLYALDGSVDLLHVAAHGSFDSESPRFSRLALAPGGGDDGYLEVHEIFGRLDLAGVNLVVLSACETALGERSGGDDLVSVTRALHYAGTPGVLSTLWKVDDLATAELMARFYPHLLAGCTAAEALRAAQVELARGETEEGGIDTSDSYYWAGFVLSGDPQGRWEGQQPQRCAAMGREAVDEPHPANPE